MKKYVWAFDLSLKCTGVAIFTNDGRCVHITSIETDTQETTARRLYIIGQNLLELAKKYKPSKIIIEQGFTRFNISTQQLFRVHGMVNYLFYGVEQIYYPSLTIRKIVAGKGNIKKDEVRELMLRQYPNMEFNNYDESDAFITGLAYFKDKNLKEGLLGNAEKDV